jgi:hypothetical protein
MTLIAGSKLGPYEIWDRWAWTGWRSLSGTRHAPEPHPRHASHRAITPGWSATLTLGLFHDCPYPTAIVHIRSFEPLFVGHRRTTISHPTYTVQFYILVESVPDAPSGGFDA